jgi:hypothetical protein
MAKADGVHSTLPTNTSVLTPQPSRQQLQLDTTSGSKELPFTRYTISNTQNLVRERSSQAGTSNYQIRRGRQFSDVIMKRPLQAVCLRVKHSLSTARHGPHQLLPSCRSTSRVLWQTVVGFPVLEWR